MKTAEQAAMQLLKDAGYKITPNLPPKPTLGNADLKPGDKFILNRTGARYMVLDVWCSDNPKNVWYWNETERHSTVLDSRSEITKETT